MVLQAASHHKLWREIAARYEPVSFSFFQRLINEESKPVAAEISDRVAISMMEGLLLWTKGIKAIREEKLVLRQYA